MFANRRLDRRVSHHQFINAPPIVQLDGITGIPGDEFPGKTESRSEQPKKPLGSFAGRNWIVLAKFFAKNLRDFKEGGTASGNDISTGSVRLVGGAAKLPIGRSGRDCGPRPSTARLSRLRS